MVQSIHLKIENADVSLVEKGDAVLNSNGLDYLYTAATNNKNLNGNKITITAFDTPDNMSSLEKVL